MRGKTAKLIRKVARQTVSQTRVPTETQYKLSSHTNAYVLQPCLRQTIKFIKKNYKEGTFTNEDMKTALR
jgi:hypothetical protein